MFVDRSSEYFQVISWVCLVKKTHKSSVVSPYPPLPLQERERPWDLRADGERVCHQEFFCPPEKTTAWAPSGHGDSSPTDMITRYTSSPHWFYVSFPLMGRGKNEKINLQEERLSLTHDSRSFSPWLAWAEAESWWWWHMAKEAAYLLEAREQKARGSPRRTLQKWTPSDLSPHLSPTS